MHAGPSQVDGDDASKESRVQLLSDFAAGEVEEARRGRHLDGEHIVHLRRPHHELQLQLSVG